MVKTTTAALKRKATIIKSKKYRKVCIQSTVNEYSTHHHYRSFPNELGGKVCNRRSQTYAPFPFAPNLLNLSSANPLTVNSPSHFAVDEESTRESGEKAPPTSGFGIKRSLSGSAAMETDTRAKRAHRMATLLGEDDSTTMNREYYHDFKRHL